MSGERLKRVLYTTKMDSGILGRRELEILIRECDAEMAQAKKELAYLMVRQDMIKKKLKGWKAEREWLTLMQQDDITDLASIGMSSNTMRSIQGHYERVLARFRETGSIATTLEQEETLETVAQTREGMEPFADAEARATEILRKEERARVLKQKKAAEAALAMRRADEREAERERVAAEEEKARAEERERALVEALARRDRDADDALRVAEEDKDETGTIDTVDTETMVDRYVERQGQQDRLTHTLANAIASTVTRHKVPTKRWGTNERRSPRARRGRGGARGGARGRGRARRGRGGRALRKRVPSRSPPGHGNVRRSSISSRRGASPGREIVRPASRRKAGTRGAKP